MKIPSYLADQILWLLKDLGIIHHTTKFCRDSFDIDRAVGH